MRVAVFDLHRFGGRGNLEAHDALSRKVQAGVIGGLHETLNHFDLDAFGGRVRCAGVDFGQIVESIFTREKRRGVFRHVACRVNDGGRHIELTQWRRARLQIVQPVAPIVIRSDVGHEITNPCPGRCFEGDFLKPKRAILIAHIELNASNLFAGSIVKSQISNNSAGDGEGNIFLLR
ncbi:hypothetical protein D3C87_1134860 [compost metagenome]